MKNNEISRCKFLVYVNEKLFISGSLAEAVCRSVFGFWKKKISQFVTSIRMVGGKEKLKVGEILLNWEDIGDQTI